MANNTYTNLNDLFTAIADSIKTKKNNSEEIIADNFPTEIRGLRTGFDYNNQNVTSIADYQFYNCTDLKSVDCKNLQSIGISAFEGCSNLKTVVLYDDVTSIGENAFKGCNNFIIYCMFDSQPEGWHEDWNPDNCEVVWLGGAINTWDISATSYDNVVATLYSNGCIIINGYGNMRDFNHRMIPNGYDTDIPWYSQRSKVSIVTLSKRVTSIGNYAFYNCSSLIEINIPEGVTNIGEEAFSYCTSLESTNIPQSVTCIEYSAFYGCTGLTSITIPDSATYIGGLAFCHCTKLASITIPESVTYIGTDAFHDTAYYNDSSKWENDVLYIGNHLIRAKDTLSGTYTIKDGTLTIGGGAFYNCRKLKSITIPEGVTSIGGGAFEKCTSLQSITIPEGVTSIGNDAFDNCSGLTSITFTGTVLQWNAITFGSKWNYNTGNYTIHCTDGDISKDGTITYHNQGGVE